MTQKKLKLMNLFTVLTLILLLLFSVLPVHGEREIYDRVLRFHVIANSDSPVDQELKLKVRDRVLEYCAPMLGEAEDREQAAALIAKEEDSICRIAEQVLRENGCSFGVSMELCREKYPRKSYESSCFPAGSYLSLKLKIGEAEGKNWWCVLFPRLCTSVAAAEEEFVAVGFTPDQYKVITESRSTSYKIRFRLLEYFEEVWG